MLTEASTCSAVARGAPRAPRVFHSVRRNPRTDDDRQELRPPRRSLLFDLATGSIDRRPDRRICADPIAAPRRSRRDRQNCAGLLCRLQRAIRTLVFIREVDVSGQRLTPGGRHRRAKLLAAPTARRLTLRCGPALADATRYAAPTTATGVALRRGLLRRQWILQVVSSKSALSGLGSLLSQIFPCQEQGPASGLKRLMQPPPKTVLDQLRQVNPPGTSR